MTEYKISFWNYERTGVWDEKKAVRGWNDAGITLAMTFELSESEDKSRMMRLLDECEKANIKAIVCDERTTFYALKERGEEKFREGVKSAVKDFGFHPAVYGFHVGDEPDKTMWETAKTAFKIVREACPSLRPFINMNPTWLTPDFEDVMGTDIEGYKNNLIDFIRETGSAITSFDAYTQCMYTNKEFYKGEFIRNLQLFSEVALNTGTELFVSVLSAGHWNYRVPNEDDIRWQLNMCVAHGATGIFWFLFYQRFLDENYRGMPINLFGERTPTYYNLSYENRVFMKYFADKLQKCKLDAVFYHGEPFGNPFNGDNELLRVENIVNDCTICISRWIKDNKKKAYSFVNADQELPVRIKVEFGGELKKQSRMLWLAPGQMVYIDEDCIIPSVSYPA